jgi:hypothetical protein
MSEPLSLNSIWDSINTFFTVTIADIFYNGLEYSVNNAYVPITLGLTTLFITYAILFIFGTMYGVY